MPNSHYIKGRKKEYKEIIQAREDAEKKGIRFIGFRSAGSHSPIDVVKIWPDRKLIVFVQCKPNSMPETQKLALEEKYSYLNGDYHVEFVCK